MPYFPFKKVCPECTTKVWSKGQESFQRGDHEITWLCKKPDFEDGRDKDAIASVANVSYFEASVYVYVLYWPSKVKKKHASSKCVGGMSDDCHKHNHTEKKTEDTCVL